MRRFGLIVAGLPLVVMALQGAMAAERHVPAEPGALSAAIKGAAAGDVLILEAGDHAGPIVVGKTLTILGGGKARIVGNGTGSVVTLSAAESVLEGVTIKGSGASAEHRDAGVKIEKSAAGARVVSNRLLGNLIGVDVHGVKNAVIADNFIEGRRDHRMNSRGNGVYVWNAPGSRVENNVIRWGRDGIFVNTSTGNVFSGNRFSDLRFAIHYMYAHDSEVVGNHSTGNHLGYAIMFSKNVVLRDNVSMDDRDYGIMLNYTNSSDVSGNRILRTGDRCVFIYNAHKNRLTDNWLEGCGVGVHFTAGSERNRILGNAFVANRSQVKYVGSRWVEWNVESGGNYWSDHAAYDLDGDGLAENSYRPNGLVDRILWTQPAARMLLGAPAVQLIRWTQSTFPALLEGGVIDRRPLMSPGQTRRSPSEDPG